MNTCLSCGRPLPPAANTGRPRTTCSDRCRKRVSRQNKATKSIHHSPETMALYREVVAACNASETRSIGFTTDTGDGSDVTQLIAYARTQKEINFERRNKLAATFWL